MGTETSLTSAAVVELAAATGSTPPSGATLLPHPTSNGTSSATAINGPRIDFTATAPRDLDPHCAVPVCGSRPTGTTGQAGKTHSDLANVPFFDSSTLRYEVLLARVVSYSFTAPGLLPGFTVIAIQ